MIGACGQGLSLAVAGALAIAAPCASAGPTSRTEDAVTAATLAQLDGFAPGLAHDRSFAGAMLVSTGGSVVLERAYGKSDEKSDELNSPATRFNLASAGKMFTTVAILQQVAAGRVTLDTPVGDASSCYSVANFLHAQWTLLDAGLAPALP